MSEQPTREWRFYLDDMIGFAEKVIAYTDRLDQPAFVASGLNYDATLRNLERIGEAASHIPDALRTANPQIPWRLLHNAEYIGNVGLQWIRNPTCAAILLLDPQ